MPSHRLSVSAGEPPHHQGESVHIQLFLQIPNEGNGSLTDRYILVLNFKHFQAKGIFFHHIPSFLISFFIFFFFFDNEKA